MANPVRHKGKNNVRGAEDRWVTYFRSQQAQPLPLVLVLEQLREQLHACTVIKGSAMVINLHGEGVSFGHFL